MLALAILCSAGVWSQANDPGRFTVESASHELAGGVYYVDALISLRLPSEALNALHSRVPLTIRVEVELLNRLRLWWDTTATSASRRSQLEYHPLTDRYVVRSISNESEEAEGFATLGAALEFLGRVDHFAVAKADELERNERYDIRVRAILDRTELPGPLALLAFWRRDWSIASDWRQWRLDTD
ncbi:MAG TPA: DUF4390 domain-containing protein [Gammaproteobacteria bacterium]|nr:DUF4390 domain-containing protein [Gammaproteobacteria bacterium]